MYVNVLYFRAEMLLNVLYFRLDFHHSNGMFREGTFLGQVSTSPLCHQIYKPV